MIKRENQQEQQEAIEGYCRRVETVSKMVSRGRTDEVSTDVSETNSERSLMITETSSPFRSIFSRTGKVTNTGTLEESDKQILEWAGKLELESMELRENSDKLIKVLNENSKTLCKSLNKFNQLLEQDAARNGSYQECAYPQVIYSFPSEMHLLTILV